MVQNYNTMNFFLQQQAPCSTYHYETIQTIGHNYVLLAYWVHCRVTVSVWKHYPLM